MASKLTIKEQFIMVNEVLAQAGRDDLVKFIDSRIELQGRKHSSQKQTGRQKANEELKAVIVSTLEGMKPMTVTDLMKSNEELSSNNYSNQKISAMLRQLVNEERVVKTIKKDKSLFALV